MRSGYCRTSSGSTFLGLSATAIRNQSRIVRSPVFRECREELWLAVRLRRRLPLEDRLNVLETRLACIRGFERRDRSRDVAHERDGLLFRFVGKGEVGIARQRGVQLDGVYADFLESANGASRLGFISDGELDRTVLHSIENGAHAEDMRP
jgi:hypothetical protein